MGMTGPPYRFSVSSGGTLGENAFAPFSMSSARHPPSFILRLRLDFNCHNKISQ